MSPVNIRREASTCPAATTISATVTLISMTTSACRNRCRTRSDWCSRRSGLVWSHRVWYSAGMSPDRIPARMVMKADCAGCPHRSQIEVKQTRCTPLEEPPHHQRRRDAEYPASKSKHHRLGQQQAKDAPAAGAERRPDRDLPFAAGPSREHEDGDVGAPDEEREQDGHPHQPWNDHRHLIAKPGASDRHRSHADVPQFTGVPSEVLGRVALQAFGQRGLGGTGRATHDDVDRGGLGDRPGPRAQPDHRVPSWPRSAAAARRQWCAAARRSRLRGPRRRSGPRRGSARCGGSARPRCCRPQGELMSTIGQVLG